jgi:hypothetical protein
MPCVPGVDFERIRLEVNSHEECGDDC